MHNTLLAHKTEGLSLATYRQLQQSLTHTGLDFAPESAEVLDFSVFRTYAVS